MIASGPMRQLELARRCGVASLTVKRRVARLVEAGMIAVDAGLRFNITKTGIAALGGDAPPKPVSPWLKVEAVSAAGAKDVAERMEHHKFDDRSNAMKSRHGTEARLKSIETARRNGSERFNRFGDLDRMTG